MKRFKALKPYSVKSLNILSMKAIVSIMASVDLVKDHSFKLVVDVDQ